MCVVEIEDRLHVHCPCCGNMLTLSIRSDEIVKCSQCRKYIRIEADESRVTTEIVEIRMAAGKGRQR